MSEPLLPHPSTERPEQSEQPQPGVTVEANAADDETEPAARPSVLPRPEAGDRLSADELRQELDAD